MSELKMWVAKHPDKSGFTIYHNQPIGWKGTLKKHFGWYKYKPDAEKRKDELYNAWKNEPLGEQKHLLTKAYLRKLIKEVLSEAFPQNMRIPAEIGDYYEEIRSSLEDEFGKETADKIMKSEEDSFNSDFAHKESVASVVAGLIKKHHLYKIETDY